MRTLSNKVAIVTGASKGIGAAIARTLASAGARVVVNFASSSQGANAVVSQIKAAGGEAVPVQGDVSRGAEVKRLFAETKKAFGRLDVLVNNAGVFKFGPFLETTEEIFHWHYNINVLGPVLTTRESLSYFGPEGGSVINLSSVVGSHPAVGGVIYSSTKGAIENLTRGLALELGPRKIRVNAIAPGLTETEGTRAIGFTEGENAEKAAATTPLGRIGQPEDIARAVLFLASDDSAWITGEVIRAAGGAVSPG